MGILGIGVDILHLPRLRSLISRRGVERVSNRILSLPELVEWRQIQLQQSESALEDTREVLERQTSFLAVR